MDRRTFIAGLLASPGFLAILQSCGDSSDGTSPSTDTGTHVTTPSTGGSAPGVARSDKSRADAAQLDPAQAVAMINGLTIDLFDRMAADGSANRVFSAASIAIALAMTRVGAAGTTASEMDTVLGITDPASMPVSMNALTTALDSRTQTIDVPGGDPVDIVLAIANSLWAQQDLAFETAFLDTLATQFGAGLELVDYATDADGARQEINAWVDEATKDRIPELLAPGTIGADTRLTLVNAIYMKAPWLNTFATSQTAPADFTTTAGTVVQAPTMHLNARLNVSQGDGWRAVELPYYGRSLSMLIVLPDSDGTLAPSLLGSATAASPSSKQVDLALPSFDIETKADLEGVLSALGMPTAFDPATADFSLMTKVADLCISKVVHQANITVDEEGTEAAAATAVIAVLTAAPMDPPIEFHVDKPFLFAIRDNTTGALLFAGSIGDPTQTRS